VSAFAWKFVPTPADKPAILKKPPLFVPPLSKILSLSLQTSIVIPLLIVVFVTGLLSEISPPSSPAE